MKATNYTQINAGIRLHLEYDKMTVGELSNITRQWQALLRAAWRESYPTQAIPTEPLPTALRPTEPIPTPPNARVIIITASTENSLELIAEYALITTTITAAVFGPMVDWPGLARAAYRHIQNKLEGSRETGSVRDEGRIYMRSGDREVNLPNQVLADDETGERARKLMETFFSGGISGTIEEIDEPDSGEHPEDTEPV